MKKRIVWLTEPKNLLLVDFFGALLTSFFTGVVLTTILSTGLPTGVLIAFSIAAATFACVDVVSYCKWPDQGWPLIVVGMLNLLYCATSMTVVLMFMPLVTTVGITYVAVECAIVVPLAAYELVVARRWQHRQRTNNELQESDGLALRSGASSNPVAP